MTTPSLPLKPTFTAQQPAPVPLLDVNRQNQPLRDEILAAITEVVDSGAFLKGPAVRQLEAEVAQMCGVDHAVGCASGSDALLVALMALEIGPGDEVILPSFTFFATAGAVTRLGATPVFADILPDTFNIDPADIARRITPATKAIIPVHLFGQSADMDAINAIAADHGLTVIEDAAQAIGATYQGQPIGSLGRIGCISSYPTKNLGGMGDGGMITTNDPELADRMRVLCDHGQEPRYYHHYVGLNSRLDTIQAAALRVKVPKLAGYAEARTRHAARYDAAFVGTAVGAVMTTPTEAHGCPSVWNQYTVRVEQGRRDSLQQWLTERKIGSAIYYPVPLHLQKCFANLGYRRGDLPHTERAADEVLSLPIFPELTYEEQGRVIDAVHAYAAAATVRRAA
jgi:dTDP-4-amino-4,6-dideoxygalactose transaminase